MNVPEFLDNPRSKAAGLLVASAEIFGHPVFSSVEPVRLFFMAVGCDEEAAVGAALCEWLRIGRKFPAPADIRDLLEARVLMEAAGVSHD